MGRNVLVVTTVEGSADALRPHVGEADSIEVVVPIVRQSALDWLANDERAYTRGVEVAQETAAALPGETVDATAGEADVALAIRDALATFPADEIVVAVRPEDEQQLVEALAGANAPRASIDGVPVRRVVVPDES